MYIFLLIILGFFLRIINIDKPEGLWNDEYVSWFVASTPFNEGFWNEVLKQCHMPLYYLYLKPFAGCGDLILRLTSVLPSLLAIPVMYFVGKEFSKKTGLLCAGITSILPFLVYYSQEVRFYSLLFLFSAFLLLFTLRIVNGNKAWLGFTVSSILILLTHILGGIYVGLTLFYIFYKKKTLNIKTLVFLLIGFIALLPLGLNILKMLPVSQWWGDFSYTNILFLFSDYFSPILTNNINAPKTFFYSRNIFFIGLLLLPTLLAIWSIVKGIKKAKGVASIALGVILITSCLAISGVIVFITKYTIEILPILILLLCLGVESRKDCVIISIFIAFQLLSSLTPYYPAKIYRAEGNRLVANILNETKQDCLLFTYYEPNRFTRYLKTKVQTYHISKKNRFVYLKSPKEILDNVKIGERVSIVFLDSVSFIPELWIEEAKSKNLPEMFITFSIIRNLLTRELNDNYGDFVVKKDGSWTIINAVRLR